MSGSPLTARAGILATGLMAFLATSAAAQTPAVPVERAKPRTNLNNYFSPHDYPQSALRHQEEGSTAFELEVDKAGRVSGCRILSSSGSSALDAVTCRLMRSRARFTPAQDGSGNPVPDNARSSFDWVLPDPQAPR